jgi:hypothetical protein
MADLKEEASSAYYATKADAKIALTRGALNSLGTTGPTGKPGPELTKVIQEFDGYVAAWEAAKKDPAFKADPAQVANLAQAVAERMDVYVAVGQQADIIDDAKANAAKAKSDEEYSKLADESAKKRADVKAKSDADYAKMADAATKKPEPARPASGGGSAQSSASAQAAADAKKAEESAAAAAAAAKAAEDQKARVMVVLGGVAAAGLAYFLTKGKK